MGRDDIKELTNGTFKESFTFRLFPISKPPEACPLIRTKKDLRLFKSKQGWVLSTLARNLAVSSELQVDYLISLPKFLNGSWKRCSLCSVEELGLDHVKLRWINSTTCTQQEA